MKRSNFALRLHPVLMEEARALAKAEGVALNQLINVAVAEKLGVARAAEFFRPKCQIASMAESGIDNMNSFSNAASGACRSKLLEEAERLCQAFPERDARHQSRGSRHCLQAARNDRVGVICRPDSFCRRWIGIDQLGIVSSSSAEMIVPWW
jgi:hypothetical protein